MAPGRQLTFPSIQDGASFRVPQGTTQRRFQLTDAVSARARRPRASRSEREVSRTKGDFVLGVFREGRVELVQDFPEFDLNRDGRVDDDDLLFAVTLRSGKPDQDLLLDGLLAAPTWPGFVQDDWRVTPQLTLNLGPALRAGHRREEHLGLRRHQPDRAAVPRRATASATRTTSGRASASPGRSAGGRAAGPRRLRHLLRPRHPRDHLARARARRPRPAHRGAGRQRVLPRSRHGRGAAVRPDVQRIRSPASSCPGRAPPASTSSTTACENPTVQQFNLGTQVAAARGTSVLRVDLVHNLGTHFIIGRPDRRGLQPGGGRARPRREPRVERQHEVRRGCWRPSRSASGPRASSPALAYALSARAELRERRPDPVRQRAPSTRTTSRRSTVPPRTSSAIAWCSRAPSLLPGRVRLSPIWTIASGVPMDILMPDASSRVPTLRAQRGRPALQNAARAQRLPHAA